VQSCRSRLGEWLFDVAEEMTPRMASYGSSASVKTGDDVHRFTDDGIESLKELMAIHKDTRASSKNAAKRSLR
jgi:hypothetical protein